MAKHICNLKLEEFMIHERTSTMDKILGVFQDMVLVSNKNPRTGIYFRSYTEIEAEKRRQLTSKQKVVHPFSVFRVYFELVMLFIFFMHLITTPYYMYCDAIFTQDSTVSADITLYLGFIFSVIDLASNFFTGYQEEYTKKVVIDLKMIRRRYLRSFFFFSDLISTIPVEFVIYSLPRSHAHHIRWLQILCLTRLFRLPTTIVYMNNCADLWHVSTSIYRTLRYVVFSVLILHWISCLSAIFSQYFFMYNLARTQNNWIRAAEILESSSPIISYVKILFRTTSQLLGVHHGMYPTTTVEDKLLTVVVFITGAFLMSLFLVLTLQMIMGQFEAQMLNVTFLNQLNLYMDRNKLPLAKQDKLIKYYKYQTRENSFYDKEVFGLLSDSLRDEVVNHTYRELVKNVSIFGELPRETINMMLRFLEREIFMPGDYVVRSGTIGNTLYFIVHGTVAVITYFGTEICHLHDGAYFGEVSLLIENTEHTANVIALEISEICRLDREWFELCIDKDSDAYRKLVEHAKERQVYLEKLNELHVTNILNESVRKSVDSDTDSDTAEPEFKA